MFYLNQTSVVEDGATIGEGTKVWHFCHIDKNAKIGQDCVLGQNVYVGEGVVIGNGVKIQNNVSIYSGVTLADWVFVGPSVVFTNIKTPRSEFPRKGAYLPTVVERGVSIGANSTIICGVTLVHHTMVGAGSVVTKSTPAYSVVIGNPAKTVGYACFCGGILKENGTHFLIKKYKCPECGQKYKLVNRELNRVFAENDGP